MKDDTLVDKDKSLNQDQKEACIGIVFWKDDVIEGDKTLKINRSDCTHGLVVALKEYTDIIWQDPYGLVQDGVGDEFLSVQSGGEMTL